MTIGTGVREYLEADEPALLRLAQACVMEGDVGLAVHRYPRFTALNELVGDPWRLGVVEDRGGVVVGCVAVAKRQVYVNGHPQSVRYVSDFKIHPAARAPGTALGLVRWARDVLLRDSDGDPALLAVLGGNRVMERRFGDRRRSDLCALGTIRSHSVGLLWQRSTRVEGVDVSRATPALVEEMWRLWLRTAPKRQFAPHFDAPDVFTGWIERAPGLSLDDYLVARDERSGELLGFFGLWEQSALKQTVVTSYSTGLRVFRAAFNALAPAVGATRLSPAGSKMPLVSAVHVCVTPGDVRTMHALVRHAYGELRGTGAAFFTVGLDRSEQMDGAFKGLIAQSLDTTLCLAVPSGSVRPQLDARPAYHDIALV